MILVDAGPLVAIFNPKDNAHRLCRVTLKALREPLVTTTPILTEAFHILGPGTAAANRLRDFIQKDGLAMSFLDRPGLSRAFELMEVYADCPMDFADASLVAAAERLDIRTIFTIDRNDFETYRIRRGHRHYALAIVP
ncbi:MAG TPA: PIN domain-containing protein [Vicinamibacterales bacterium]